MFPSSALDSSAHFRMAARTSFLFSGVTVNLATIFNVFILLMFLLGKGGTKCVLGWGGVGGYFRWVVSVKAISICKLKHETEIASTCRCLPRHLIYECTE